MGARRTECPLARWLEIHLDDRVVRAGSGEREADLAAAGQFDIDLRQQLGIEQRTVPDPVAAIDSIAGAQRVERQFRARMTPLRDSHGIDHAAEAHRFQPAQVEFRIEKGEIEARVVSDERGIGDEFQKLVAFVAEPRLIRQESRRKAVNRLSRFGHVAIRIEIGVVGGTGRNPVHEFYATNLHHPVARPRIEASGFGIEHDFAHGWTIYRPVMSDWQVGGRSRRVARSGHCGDQLLDRFLGREKGRSGIDQVIRPRPLFRVGNLEREDVRELVRGHARPREHARTLALYRRLSLFVAENFEHMLIEETRHNSALWAHYSDEELAALHNQLVASIPPQEMMATLRWLVPYMAHGERCALLGEMRAHAPAPAFEAALSVVRPHLSDRDWGKLSCALGLTA